MAVLALSTTSALAAGVEGAHIENVDFSFDGFTGTYDQNQLQRGLKVYTEICSACHGLKQVPFRTLADEGGVGFSEDQMKAYTSGFEVFDQTLNDGEGDYRTALPSDHFPAVVSAGAPDMSLIAKARAGFHGPYNLGINQLLKGTGGPEYIAALLQGYEEPPACAPEDFSGYYNKYFTAGGYPAECIDDEGHHTVEGSWIAMSQPLYGDDVTFDDGAPSDLAATSEDVAAFLMWTAEPKLAARKQMGLTAIIMLSVLSVLLYLTNKRIWAPVKGKGKRETA
ncbi:MAG: cytochrome c1 [Jannaschia sp.]